MLNREIVVLAHNIRSTHNIGAIFRTSDGLGVKKLLLSGYTPYPISESETRLPHLANKISSQIHKTALGAENKVKWEKIDSPQNSIQNYRELGYEIIGLEQNEKSIELHAYQPPHKVLLVLGEEIQGISSEMLQLCDQIVEIPMRGTKESFNVSVAFGICLYAMCTN